MNDVEAVKFNGLKVFSATKAQDRAMLGEVITDWMRANPDKIIVDRIVTQSSDSEFHCLTITIFYRFEEPEPRTFEERAEGTPKNPTPKRLKFSETPERR